MSGNDVGQLDLETLRIVGGGFRAADLSVPNIGFINYEPFANLTGPDVVLYEICSTRGLCDTTTLTIDVIPG